jgi:hypothetical protein
MYFKSEDRLVHVFSEYGIDSVFGESPKFRKKIFWVKIMAQISDEEDSG